MDIGIVADISKFVSNVETYNLHKSKKNYRVLKKSYTQLVFSLKMEYKRGSVSISEYNEMIQKYSDIFQNIEGK